LQNRLFYKYEGSGNDFVLFENNDNTFPIQKDLIARICNRHFGIGADGLILLEKSRLADVKMRILNQDGSEATMCGNGLRCTTLHFAKNLSIETLAGVSEAIYTPRAIRVSIPKAEIINCSVLLPNGEIGHLINTGTPHLVIFRDNIEDEGITPTFRSLFGGVNVNLAKITPQGIAVRTFEKGVDKETLSCGSGGAAVALLQKTKKPIRILFTSSTLTFSFDSEGRIWMDGPAKLIFQGTLCLKNLE
jgi:diaminopimelate epimerase